MSKLQGKLGDNGNEKKSRMTELSQGQDWPDGSLKDKR